MKIIGHRGARGLAPENTVVAMRKGLEHNVDMLELDLRVTKDGVVILHHDRDITDPNGDKHVIAALNYAVLKEHKPDLATFKEVLDTIGHPVPLYVEVKPHEPTAPIIKTIRSYIKNGWKHEYFIFASFSQNTLLELHKALPKIDTVVLEKWSGLRATYRAKQLDTRNLCINQKWLWKPFIVPLARRGWNLYAYTLNDPVKAKRWASYGLAGVVTDFPDRFERIAKTETSIT